MKPQPFVVTPKDYNRALNVIGTKVTVLGMPGTFVHLPGGTVHSFRYGASGGKTLEITGQGSFASKMFTNIDAEIPPGPPDIPKLMEILKKNGVTVAA